MEEDFAASIQNIDQAESDNGKELTIDFLSLPTDSDVLVSGSEGEDNAEDGFEDKVDWDRGGVEEPDERKELNPEIWDAPGELDERGEDDENDGTFPFHSLIFSDGQ